MLQGSARFGPDLELLEAERPPATRVGVRPQGSVPGFPVGEPGRGGELGLANARFSAAVPVAVDGDWPTGPEGGAGGKFRRRKPMRPAGKNDAWAKGGFGCFPSSVRDLAGF